MIEPQESAFLRLVHFLYLQKNLDFILTLLVFSAADLRHFRFPSFQHNPQHSFLAVLALRGPHDFASGLPGWHS